MTRKNICAPKSAKYGVQDILCARYATQLNSINIPEGRKISKIYNRGRQPAMQFSQVCMTDNVSMKCSILDTFFRAPLVIAEEQENNPKPFEEKMERLTSVLSQQFEESNKLEQEIKKNLEDLGYEL